MRERGWSPWLGLLGLLASGLLACGGKRLDGLSFKSWFGKEGLVCLQDRAASVSEKGHVEKTLISFLIISPSLRQIRNRLISQVAVFEFISSVLSFYFSVFGIKLILSYHIQKTCFILQYIVCTQLQGLNKLLSLIYGKLRAGGLNRALMTLMSREAACVCNRTGWSACPCLPGMPPLSRKSSWPQRQGG